MEVITFTKDDPRFPWRLRIDGRLIGDAPGFDTEEQGKAWARKWFAARIADGDMKVGE